MSNTDESRIPERREISEEYTWDLSRLSPSDDQWERDLPELEGRIM